MSRQDERVDRAPGRLTVATCQFPVDADISRNLTYVLRQIRQAAGRGADVVHFPECALSGYAGSDMADLADLDWGRLEQATYAVMAAAAKAGVWVVLGSTHRLSEPNKPHNSLYIIDAAGEIVDRYDKRFCASDRTGRTGDLAHYSPGDHFTVFDVRGIRCGAAICHDYRYPELYREYKRLGVQLMFHSYHAAHASPDTMAQLRAEIGVEQQALNPGLTYPGITMPASMTAAAASSHVWISCPNSSAPESCWGAFFVRADGVTTGRLPRNRAGILISTVDTSENLYDSTHRWREHALAGVLNSGSLVRDERSANRTAL
ncbi:carbon-nitrogen hydrolase family protein [Micromonospora sp. NPDC126480]|uniref:carbon-nitrogen hydrolase family protein n=1 Tax=Micromonospora sp. NPDC126480 TaxID=3155312 RepID=UPI003318F65D